MKFLCPQQTSPSLSHMICALKNKLETEKHLVLITKDHTNSKTSLIRTGGTIRCYLEAVERRGTREFRALGVKYKLTLLRQEEMEELWSDGIGRLGFKKNGSYRGKAKWRTCGAWIYVFTPRPVIYTPLYLMELLGTDSGSSDHPSATVYIEYGKHRYSKYARTTRSDTTPNDNLTNIAVVGSKYSKENKHVRHLDYGLPVIVYRRGNMNHLTVYNELNESSNLHPHGLDVDPFVDGASIENQFGPDTQIGRKIYLEYPILNNSMTSAWHPHPMFRASRLLYGGMFMPYIIRDDFSDKLDSFFTLGQNDIPLCFSNVDLDRNGKLNSARTYSYVCINLEVSKDILQNYPYIDYAPMGNSDKILYCSSLGAWRGTFLQINGKVTNSFTPNRFCPPDDVCKDSLFCRTKQCTSKYNQLLTHTVKTNLLRLRLIHAGSSFRRNCFGFIDSHKNFLDFWVIASDAGFVSPWKTKMISLETLSRFEVVVDAASTCCRSCCLRRREIFLISFDFDITLMEKLIVPLPYMSQGLSQYDLDFFKRFSIYTGCLVDEHDKGSLSRDIFREPDRSIFLRLLNLLRPANSQTDTIPYFPVIKFDVKIKHKQSLDRVLNTINQDIIKNKSYYSNAPGEVLLTRKITTQTGMQLGSDCWIQETDPPSLKFKFTNATEKSAGNIRMMTNTKLTVEDWVGNTLSETHNLKFPETTMPLDIDQLVDLFNNVFKDHDIDLVYRYEKFVDNVADVADINSVRIIIQNTSSDTTYILRETDNIMQFMGIEYKWGSLDIDLTDPKKTTLALFLSSTEDPDLVKITNNPDIPTMGIVEMAIHPGKSHQGNPFQVMNDNIMNFSVKENSTERWIIFNSDGSFFDNHPFHFHLSHGFMEVERSSFINTDHTNAGPKDVYSIKFGSQLAFKLKFGSLNSTMGTIPYLGYMFHCHYLMHHDMNMMGQFYVEP